MLQATGKGFLRNKMVLKLPKCKCLKPVHNTTLFKNKQSFNRVFEFDQNLHHRSHHSAALQNRKESRVHHVKKDKYWCRPSLFSTQSSEVVSNATQFTSTRSTSTSKSQTNEDIEKVDINQQDTMERDGHLVSKYRSMSKANESNGNVMLDEHQIEALHELDRLRSEIISSSFYNKATATENSAISTSRSHSSSIGDGEEESSSYSSLFPFKLNSSTFSSFLNIDMGSPGTSTFGEEQMKGVYLHGGVGCGKTFCMDLFFHNLPITSKQKVHFHKFMLNVHQQMHEAKIVNGIEGDVLPSVIDRILNAGLIICFDEFQVTDVADALILRRLFTGLLDKGAIIVATSNRPPSDLYLNGLQRDLFIPFIDLLIEKNQVISMWDSDTDYRLIQGGNKARGVYFIGDEDKADFEKAFVELTKGSSITKSSSVSTQGRKIKIPKASLEYRVARFSFDNLCREARGAADYLVIGEHFHTVFVEDIPALFMNDVNLVRRLIVFVDAMYECHVKLILHAATKPDEIFKVDLDNEYCDEAFAFDRTRSRLEEMGSDEYLKSRWIDLVPKKLKFDWLRVREDKVSFISDRGHGGIVARFYPTMDDIEMTILKYAKSAERK